MQTVPRAIHTVHAPWLVFAALVPWTTAIASYCGTRSVLLGIYLLLGLSVLVVVLRPPNDRTLLILTASMSLSLLLSFTLTSTNLIGWDIHGEYYAFIQVIGKGMWDPQARFEYNSAVSISILPAIIDLVTSLNGVQIFKFVIPVIFSAVPVVLYRVYSKFLEGPLAFLAVFLFMSYPTFYGEMIALGRQEIAEVFLTLLLLVFLSPKISRKRQGRLMIIGLTLGLVLAHYSLTYIYLLIILFSYVSAKISKKVLTFSGLAMLAMSLLIAFAWYLFVAGGTTIFILGRFISFVTNGISQDFFTPSSRPTEVLQAFGLASGYCRSSSRCE